MKKTLLSIIAFAIISTLYAQNSKQADQKQTATAVLNSQAIAKKDSVKAMPAIVTPISANKSEAVIVPTLELQHRCSDKCKGGNHIYAHGEKGHTCTGVCKKKV